MDSSRNSSKAKAAKGTTAALGLFAIVYVVWFLYAVIVLYPNDANSSLIGAVGLSLMASLGVTTVAMSRSIWLRSSGRSTNARLFWIYTPFMVVFPVLVYPLSPTTLIFVIFAFVLLLLNKEMGRATPQHISK